MTTVTNSDGLRIPFHQYTDIPRNLKHETYIIPSTSAPSWGGYFTFDFKEKSTMIHNLRLQFYVSAISGLTGSVSGYPNYNPSQMWFTRLEIVQNGNVIDTRYPIEQYLHTQWFNSDENRLKINTAAGLYSSNTARNALATTASAYYIDLTSLFNLGHIPILFQSSEVQLRIYMDTLANQVNVSTLTGTPISTISGSNLIAKITRLPQSEVQKLTTSMARSPHHYLFNELRYGTYTIQSGTSSTNIVLSSIVGPVSYLFFTVRPTASMTGTNQYAFTQITSFSILDSTSTNIVGGQDLPSALCLYILNTDWTISSYSTEAANNAYAYIYSFSSDPISTATNGSHYGTHMFMGNEQLKITFTSTLSSPAQIDVYASVQSILEISPSYTKKVTIMN
jgi:hypothetical protein